MENVLKTFAGFAASALSFFAPIKGLVLCAVVFIAIDFVTGIAASRKRSRRRGVEWGFESAKAWNTIYKLLCVMAGIVLAWLIDEVVLSFMQLRLANLFTGFVCGVEFWSYLENAADISDHPLFLRLKKIMKRSLEKKFKDDAL